MMLHIDRCLGCMACVPACPSGVEYGHLLAPFRAQAESQRSRPWLDRLARLAVKETLPFPKRFRIAAALGRFAQPFQRLLPSQFQAMLKLLPAHLPPSQPLPTITPAIGRPRARVALLAGCVQQVLAPEINAATVRVLARNGVEVVIPPDQGCCGSLALHIGAAAQAKKLASSNFAAFPSDVDAIVTNAAGCGSGMHEYPLLFAGDPAEATARNFAGRVLDVSVFLANLGLTEELAWQEPLRLAYHDACHLAHAQGVTLEPRKLLRQIPQATLLEIPESDLCCGSAGVYNLEQPELAGQIGLRKARNVVSTEADIVVTGNIGCMMQLRTHLQNEGSQMAVLHTMQILDMAGSTHRLAP
jgi:glycolate oxidase iron-sulfur subunit